MSTEIVKITTAAVTAAAAATASKVPKVSVITPETLFVTPAKTYPADTNSWICGGVPCIYIDSLPDSEDKNIKYIKPFNKGIGSSPIKLSMVDDWDKYGFKFLDRTDTHVLAPGYPTDVPISEFSIKPINLAPLIGHYKAKDAEFTELLTLIKKANQDAHTAKGQAKAIDIITYRKYKENSGEGKDEDKEEPNPLSKLTRIGDPVFNRTSRQTIPVPNSFTREDFEKHPSFPAPIGIRTEDFTWPSEQNAILIEQLSQVFSCEGAPECPVELVEKYGLIIAKDSHKCDWCGEVVSMSNLKQAYCSTTHTINFCHKDPSIGTKKGNVYIGHCSCNREQGGYSEEERVYQIARLCRSNPQLKELLISIL